MNYQDILGSCHETTVAQLASRCPQTLEIFRKYVPEIDADRQTTVEIVASIADINPERLCQELFDTVMEQTPIEEMDTDVLLELILRGYDVGHLEQLPKRQLNKLRQMTRNYRAPDSACRSWLRFYRELKALGFRMSKQIYLEQNVLFPRFQF